MRGCWRRLICVAWVVYLPTTSFAQQAQTNPLGTSPSSPDTLDQLQIIASPDGPPQTGDVVADEHTGSHTRIPYFRLEQPGSQLANILSTTAGVQQRQSGGFGTFSSITVRAASAAQTAVYLDGILVNSGGEPVVDLSTLEILNLASVDLYRGSTPLQLGVASIGGAVNLNTLRSDVANGRKTRLRLGFGSFSQASVLAAHHGARDKWDWTTSISHQQSENDFPFFNDRQTDLNADDDSREQRRNNDVQRSALLVKAGYASSELARTDVLFQVANRDLGVPDVLNTIRNKARFETSKSQLQLSQTIDEWRDWNSRHSVYWHETNSLYDDRLGTVGLGRQLSDTDITTLGAKTYWERFVTAGTAGLSVDIRDESIDLQDNADRRRDRTAQRQRFLATAHMAIIDDNDRWMLTPALRWQHSETRGTSNALGTPANAPLTKETELGVQLGAAYYLSPKITLTFNAGNYFREPAFGELFGSIGLVNGNPDLKPEEGINTDVGIGYATEQLQFDATLFYSPRDELIVTSFDARGIGRPRNTGKANVTGIELSAGWAPTKHWQLSANATFQDPVNLDDETSSVKDKLLPGEPTRSAFARAQYQPSNIAYWYEWQADRERFYDLTNSLLATDTSVHSIGLNWQNKLWQLSTRIQNIGNDNVEDFNGFPKPGRSFSIAVTRDL